MKMWLRPLSYLYEQTVAAKTQLYDRGWFFRYKAPCKVLSVGNLTMGGTGKTPLVDHCLKYFKTQNISVAVISRSYRTSLQQASQVDLRNPDAAGVFGDEPVLLAKANPDTDFYSGPTKWKTAQLAVAQKSYDLLLVDDGFQHLALQRDFDLVVLDATESLSNYRTVPQGRARESWQALQRADLLAVTKCNWAAESDLQALIANLPKGKKTIFFDYLVESLNWKKSNFKDSDLDFKNKKALLVSAIGKPKVFETQMTSFTNVVGHKVYRDHHSFSASDVSEILKLQKELQADYLLMTEKDAVKFDSLLSQDINWAVAPLKVVERNSKGALHEVLRQII